MRYVALAVLVLVGCDITEPSGAYPIDPPSIYRTWYDLTAACVGSDPGFDRIRWYVVPGDGWTATEDRPAHGEFVPPASIYISEHRTEDELLVRHELVHYAITPTRGHPEPPFGVCDRDTHGFTA